jgi:hypothetical protein
LHPTSGKLEVIILYHCVKAHKLKYILGSHAAQNKIILLNVSNIYYITRWYSSEVNKVNGETRTHNCKRIYHLNFVYIKAGFQAKHLKLHSIKYNVLGYVSHFLLFFLFNFSFSHFLGSICRYKKTL